MGCLGLQGFSCPVLPPLLPPDELTCSARLTVRPSLAPLFTRLLEDVEVLEGRAAHLDCKISGTPPPSVTWTHFGMCPRHPAAEGRPPGPRPGWGVSRGPVLPPCPPAPGRQVEESDSLRLRQDGGLHSLHIAHVSSEDEGLYAVSATNAHGQAHCSAQLYVEEPRTAASGPRCHSGPTPLGAALRWEVQPGTCG